MQRSKKDKGKKNTQSIPMVVTQNTNLFSQLSAQYLQSKTVINEDQKKFIDNTQVIEYHDQEINRILQKLRKKDETTKVKAILQLKQQILKMEQSDVASFASTFCYLFRSLVLNEESKKVQTELNQILQHLLRQYKKALLPNIAVLFPALLIFQKVNRSNLLGLLFSGEDKSQKEKALTLLLKNQVPKQFIVVARIIIDQHDKDRLGQSLLQNNCWGLIKAFKEMVSIRQQQQLNEMAEQWDRLYNQFKELVVSPGAIEFLKQNTKAKAALLEIYAVYVQDASKSGKLTKDDEYMLKQVMDNFLEKESVIHSSLWRHCNVKILNILARLDRNKQIQQMEGKLLSAMEIGGQDMFKNLTQFVQLLPSFNLDLTDATKFLNTFTFIKKINETLLSLQEYNQLRLKCYEQLNTYFLSLYQEVAPKLSQLRSQQKQQKKWQQCKKVLQKAQRSIVQNLEQYYYKNPPMSKNSLSFYIPATFSSLIRRISVLPRFNFNPPLTYSLYSEVAEDQKFKSVVDDIYNSRKTLDQILEYFERFPARHISITMEGGDLPEIYKKCRIYQLTIDYQQPEWFKWSTYYNFFMFDPMLETKHISQIQANQNIQFNPKLSIEKMDKYIPQKFKFMQRLLEQQQPQVKYFIPSYLGYLSKFEQSRNIQTLIRIYNESRQKLVVPNTNIIQTVQAIAEILVEQSKWSKLNIPLPDIFEFILYLFDYNLEAQAYGLLDKCMQLKDNQNQFGAILDSMRRNILQRIQKYVDSGEILQQKKEKLLKKKVNKFIILLNRTIDLLVFINKRDQIQIIVTELLKQEYFKYALYRPEIWILLHSIASHLSTDQIQSLVLSVINSGSHYILGLLICVNSLYPLQTNLQLKKFYQQIYVGYISPRIIDLFEKDSPKGYQIISTMLQLCQKSLIFSTGIKNLVKQSVIEQIPQPIIEKLFRITVQNQFNRIESKDPHLMRRSITIQTIIPQFSKYLERNHKNIFSESLSRLQQIKSQDPNERILLLVYLDIVCLYWNQKVETGLMFEIDLQGIIQYLFSNLDKEYININYQIQVLLNFMNVIIQNKTLEPFSDHLLSIEKHINQLIDYNMDKNAQFMSNALIKLCEFLRKILNIVEAFSSEFRDNLFNRILNLCQSKVKQFQEVAEDIDAGVVDQNIDNIIVEFSELINRFALVPGIQGREDQLISLLSSRFPSLQKSCFLYLKHLYEIGKGDKNMALLMMKRIVNTKPAEEISGVFSHTLLWILLFVRKMTLSTDNQQLQEFELQFQKLECSSAYINFVFRTVQHLGYDQTQQQFYCGTEQVSEVLLDWSNYMSERQLFKLLVQSLFIFSSNFPMDLRLWYDRQKDKKMQALCQKILKNIISDALFNKEIEKIELRQAEWRSQEFNVYALKKSKQIFAEYSKNNAKISLKLKIKDNYPLSPIVIDFGNQLKIQQKLNNWILKLKSLLYNQNNSICSGIILWKQNIDKQFQGLQQCAICYDIVNSQKQLPKMVCKTCKKKFHSACIRKWFQTSNKSQCPLCKSQFL